MAGVEQISAVLFPRSLFRARSELSVTSCLACAQGMGLPIATARSSPACLTSAGGAITTLYASVVTRGQWPLRTGRHTPQAMATARSSRGPCPGLCRALGPGSEYAELVALRIAQHLPAPAGVDVVGPGGTECQGLLDRRGVITAAHVQM